MESTLKTRRWLTVAGLLVLIAVAAMLRMPQLGALAFEVDEGYQLKGVGGILKHGVPRLDTGHAYTRSPPFLYLQAWCASVFGLTPFALRLPAAVFGVLCVPVGYVFGRRLVGPAVGWGLAVMLAVSGFHVELSRYGRFYTLFQMAFMLAVLAFHLGYVRPRRAGATLDAGGRSGGGAEPGGGGTAAAPTGHPRRWRIAFWVFTALAVTLHDTAVILGLCFVSMLVAAGYTWRQRGGLLVGAGVVGTMWIGYREALGRWTKALSDPALVIDHRSSAHRLQSEVPAGRLTNFIPEVALPRFDYFRALVLEHPVWLIPLVAVFVLLVVAVGWLAKRNERVDERRGWGRTVGPAALGVLILTAAVTQQGAIAVLLAVLYLALFVWRRGELYRPLPVLIFGGGLVILMLHAAINVKVMHYGRARGVLVLFDFPDWNRYLLGWLWQGWPLMLLAMPVGLVVLASKARDGAGRPRGAWLVIGLLLLGMSLGGIAEGKFNESRYFFQLYPLVLITFIAALLALGGIIAQPLRPGVGRNLVLAATVAVGLFSSPDLDPLNTWTIHQRHLRRGAEPGAVGVQPVPLRGLSPGPRDGGAVRGRAARAGRRGAGGGPAAAGGGAVALRGGDRLPRRPAGGDHGEEHRRRGALARPGDGGGADRRRGAAAGGGRGGA